MSRPISSFNEKGIHCNVLSNSFLDDGTTTTKFRSLHIQANTIHEKPARTSFLLSTDSLSRVTRKHVKAVWAWDDFDWYFQNKSYGISRQNTIWLNERNLDASKNSFTF